MNKIHLAVTSDTVGCALTLNFIIKLVFFLRYGGHAMPAVGKPDNYRTRMCNHWEQQKLADGQGERDGERDGERETERERERETKREMKREMKREAEREMER